MKKQVIQDVKKYDGSKFSSRHGVAWDSFFIRDSKLHYPDTLPDNAHDPVLDALDPIPMKPTSAIQNIKAGAGTASDVKAVILWMIQTGRIG